MTEFHSEWSYENCYGGVSQIWNELCFYHSLIKKKLSRHEFSLSLNNFKR